MRRARRAGPLLAVALGAALAAAPPTSAPPPAPPPSGADAPGLAELTATHPAMGPALAFRSAAAEVAARALRNAEDDLRRAGHGISAALAWRPSLTWRGAGDDAFALADGAWGQELTAAFGWRADAQAIVRARLAVHRAGVTLAERVNRDLRDALTRHIELQRAWIALTLAEDAAAARALTLAAAERVDLAALDGAPPDAPEPRTLLASRLETERAVAAVERAARDVAAAERRAAAIGLDPVLAASRHRDRLAPLPLEGWRLWLPAADPLATPAVTRAALDLAAAEADARRVRVGGVLDDLRLEFTRVEPDARLRAGLRLDEGRPGATLDLSLRPATRPSWTIAWSALLRVDDGFARDRARVDAAVADAAGAWAEAAGEAAWLLAAARTAALDAEADVAFAERGLALARLALREAIEAWREGERDDAAARDRADAALARVAVALERERDAFYRTWNRYLLEAERFWSAAGVLGGVLAPP